MVSWAKESGGLCATSKLCEVESARERSIEKGTPLPCNWNGLAILLTSYECGATSGSIPRRIGGRQCEAEEEESDIEKWPPSQRDYAAPYRMRLSSKHFS